MIFNSPWDDYRHRNGQPCKVLKGFYEPDEEHDQEVLPMYEIRFDDGEVIDAYPEELQAYCPECGESCYVDGADPDWRICNGCGISWTVEIIRP